jgi:subtilisin family serine protease
MAGVTAGALATAAIAIAVALGAFQSGPSAPAVWRAQADGVQCTDKPDSPNGYAVTAVGADRAQTPGTTPPIAILDSGVAQVPELAGRIRTGFNVSSGGQATPDNDGHGTAVATIAAGQAGGVRGVSPTSPVIPIKTLNARGETSADDVVRGIAEAIKRGAKVINISAAGPVGPLTADDRNVMTAIESAVSKRIVVVAPAGNEGVGSLDVPASYPHVVAVGATDASGLRSSFSNTGSGLDLVAPGDSVVTASPTFICSSGYVLVSGTSFSAPAVSGAAALLQAANPKLDASQVADMVRLHASGSSPPVWNADLGFGLLNIPSVLAAPIPRAQPTEVDDDVFWVKRRPFQLSPRRPRVTIRGRVAPRVDPADVYRVQLLAGETITAVASPAAVGVSLWSPKTGSFEITSGGRASLVRRAKGRLTGVRAVKGGTYYVAVTPAGEPAGTDYTLVLSRGR